MLNRVPQVGDLYLVREAGPDHALIGQTLPVVRVDEDGCNEYSVWLQGSISSWAVFTDDENHALEFVKEAENKMDDTRPYLEAVAT